MTRKFKLRGMGVLAALSAALVLAGCGNALLGGNVTGTGATENVLSLTAVDIPTNYAETIAKAQSGLSRSIYTTTPYNLETTEATDSKEITWVLSGSATNGATFDDEVVQVSSSNSGKAATIKDSEGADIKLAAYVWELTLTAYKDYGTSKNKNQPVLRGTTSTDLRNGSSSATFNMSTKNLDTPGTVYLTGSFNPNGVVAKYTVGIYNAYTFELVEKYTATKADMSTEQKDTNAELTVELDDTEKASDSVSIEYGKAISDTDSTAAAVTLNAGAYQLLIYFYNEEGKLVGSYPDTLVVDPGNDLEKNLGTLVGINEKPKTPTNLRAYLVKNTEDREGKYYNVKLTWDKSTYQTNYELELITYAGDGTESDTGTPEKTVYGLTATNSGVQDFANAAVRYSGSILADSTSLVLKLELGKVYDVRLRARNYVGESDWIDNATSGTFSTDTDLEAYKTERINRMRVTYDLNGGTLTLKDAASAYSGTSYIEYNSWASDSDLMKIVSGSASGNKLVHGTTAFVEWVNPSTLTKVEQYSYKNLTVIASFGDAVSATATFTPFTDIKNSEVAISYAWEDGSNSMAVTASNIQQGNVITIPKRITASGETKDTFITVTVTPASGSSYSDYSFVLYTANGSDIIGRISLPADATDANKCVFSVARYDAQKVTLAITATNSDGKTVGTSYVIGLQ